MKIEFHKEVAMKINGQYPKPPIQDKNTAETKEKERIGKQSSETKLHEGSGSISGLDLSTKRIREKLDAEPDINQEKVDAIKAKIKRGEYKIDMQKMANRMLKDALMEDLS